MKTEHSVELLQQDGIAYVTLNRPPLNVLNIAMMGELIQTLDQVAAETDVRAVVLRGEGKAFSSGVDVGEHQGETLMPLLQTFDQLILRLLRNPAPVIARIHGAALGGAFELALASDLVVAAEDARLGVPEITLGVLPPAAAVLLPRLVGRQRAMQLILTGKPISGLEAERLGLVNQAVPAGELDSAVQDLVSKLHSLSAASLRYAREAVLQTLDLPVEQALHQLERFQIEKLVPSHDTQEGLRAFMEKRPPVWRHQ